LGHLYGQKNHHVGFYEAMPWLKLMVMITSAFGLNGLLLKGLLHACIHKSENKFDVSFDVSG